MSDVGLDIELHDGRKVSFSKGVTWAFHAWAQGRATEQQQKLCLSVVMQLSNPAGMTPANVPNKVRSFVDGQKSIGIWIAQLVAGKEDQPFRLKTLGDIEEVKDENQE